MKIVSLNTWGGRMTKELLDFLMGHNDVDIFCMQEVYHEAHGKDKIWQDQSNFDLLNDIKKSLPNYICYYRPHLDDWWGLAIFAKKEVNILTEGDIFVHKFNGYNHEIEVYGHTAKNLQFLRVLLNEKPITILNIHGLWNGKGKGDTDDRLDQSKKIIDYIKSINGEYILCGDFNLNPDTESLQMIARELNCRDLIKDYSINSTRTSLYVKENRFADYVFVSKGIEITNFNILPDIVSDHTPLELEIN